MSLRVDRGETHLKEPNARTSMFLSTKQFFHSQRAFSTLKENKPLKSVENWLIRKMKNQEVVPVSRPCC